uniref:Mitochondrial protein n=1 Tax=Nicotiana tabacum TaxID=4097 RepID=A0A1S3X301_TOBAC|nr:PREDICTED: uncharacterized protein LOC107760726 [Nicotiana tabacum]
MIKSLLYLTTNRHDIVFSVGLCARFQPNPKESHLKTVKRILRYLKGTPDLCLWCLKEYSFDLVGYVDADYAGFHIDRKSTSGIAHFLVVPPTKNASKLTKVKATPRKSVNNVKVVPDATVRVDIVVKKAMIQGESVQIIASQTLFHPQVEELTVEKSVGNLEKKVDATTRVHVVEVEGSKEPMQKEASDGLSFS